MKIKDGFIVRKIANTNVVVAVGQAAENFNGMITLNDTGAFMWNLLSNTVDSENEIVTALIKEYDVDKDTAQKDVCAFIEKIKNAGFLE